MLLVFLLGCGDVSDPNGIDAAVDDSTDCESYCECMVATCDEDAALTCVEECVALEQEVRDCRLIHCGLAQNAEDEGDADGITLHCGHARGVGLCESN